MSKAETVKVVLIGESGVGKTSIIARFINDTFDPNCVTSLGASYISKNLTFPEHQKTIKFDIWDTAGQEKYRSLAKVFYKDAMMIIFVYDITNKNSFDEIKNFWYKQIKDNILSPPIFALAANKSDLYESEKVDEKEARDFADEIGAIYKATSALSNNGIDTLFTYLGKKYLNKNFNYKDDDLSGSPKVEPSAEADNSNGNQGTNNENIRKQSAKLLINFLYKNEKIQIIYERCPKVI